MGLPANISYGTVVGQFLASIADGPDPDKLPEGVAMSGYITFVASPVYVTDPTASPNPVTILKTPIICPLDSEGYLCSPYGDTSDPANRGVTLVATDDPDLNPVGWTWTVTYNLKDPVGRAAGIPYHSIYVPTGATVDLTTALPVATSNGTIITRGPQGDPGDLVSSSTGSWTGAVVIDRYPTTYVQTLTGNVTTLTLPTVYNTKSGTITLVLVQDATGGRTITWPASVKWPEGIAQQPSAAANSVSMINLVWTGQQWLGLLGGKSFA